MNEFSRYLESRLALAGLNKKTLCAKTGLVPETLRTRREDPETLKLFEIKAINKAVGLDPITMLKVAGYTTAEIKESVRRNGYV